MASPAMMYIVESSSNCSNASNPQAVTFFIPDCVPIWASIGLVMSILSVMSIGELAAISKSMDEPDGV